jgi:hypothetical protein
LAKWFIDWDAALIMDDPQHFDETLYVTCFCTDPEMAFPAEPEHPTYDPTK